LLTTFRSRLEEKVAKQFVTLGVPYSYESEKVEYVVPQRTSKYIPDFILEKTDGGKMHIEAKGRFGVDGKGVARSSSAKQRQKLILVKEQNPHLDLRIVFQNANTAIYKGSATTYSKWAESHGFPWADKGTVPPSWIEEVKHDA
jgi:hypothetical protein